MKTKKARLGQHFLKNRQIAVKTIEAAKIEKNDIVLEVGPGRGVLTELLFQKAKHVIAVEKDEKLADFLLDKFVHYKNIEIVCDDILKFNPISYKLKPKNYKIVANIPYYITSHFLRKFLESDCQPSLMVLMLQKEVANRIMAKDGKESLLSLSVKAYSTPKIIIPKISAANFAPAPKVDSAVIAIADISKIFFSKNNISEKKFFEFLRKGFSHKRKLLKNNLNLTEKTLEKCKIPALSRPENLSLEKWVSLAQLANH